MIKDNQTAFNRLHIVADGIFVLLSYLLAYMLRFDSKRGYLIYPQKYNEENDIYSKKYALYRRDSNILIQTIGLHIPQTDKEGKYEHFCIEMKKAEEDFINRLRDCLKILKENQ